MSSIVPELSVHTLLLLLQRMRSEVPLSPEQLEAVFDSLDVNNNGYLTIEQFLSGFGEY